jgi:phosphoenolpyruvate synthase/pyruvate phosphate dikinase
MPLISKDLISYKTPFEKIDRYEVGEKAWNLFRLLHFGFSVPSWLVVSCGVFNEVIKGRRGSIKNTLSHIDFKNQRSLDHASVQIREFVFQLELAKQFIQELLYTIEELFGKDILLSVRSSVLGEDSIENSFAGQMDSFLNICPAEIEEMVKKVWASAFSSRVLLYRHRKNIPLMDVSTAVIIQEMVQSASSGVLFTREPENQAKQCLISAGFGLGEGIVANKVQTDTYRIEWDSNEISIDIPVKDYRIVLGKTSQTGNQIEPVPASMGRQQVISDIQILQLRDIGIKAEKCFGSPQDIEWAYDGCGRLFILQARPIVLTRKESPSTTTRIWDNSNIVESYPGLTLPLTFSFIRDGYEYSFRTAALKFLVFRNEIKKDLPIFKNMIGLLDGRVYYNLLNWYQMLSYLPGFKKYKRSWDQMIGIKERIDFPQNKLSSLNRFFTLLITIWRLLTVGKNGRKFFNYFNSAYKRLRIFDISTASEETLISLYEAIERAFADRWHRTLYNDFCAIKYYDWLKQLCQRWGLDKFLNLHNNLLCAERGIESVAPVRSLVRITEMFRSKPTYQALLSEEDDHAIWHKIQSEIEYTELKTSLEAHLEAFGDRGLEELKLEKSSFREEPASLIRLIKNYSQLGLSVEIMEKQEQDIRIKAEKMVRHHLKNPAKWLLFRFILRNTRLSIANRENMRFARTRVFGIVRQLFRRMGDIFVGKGLLESNSDLYFLTVEEVFNFIEGTAFTQNLKALVKIRKAEYEEFINRIPEGRIQTKGIPYLNSLYEAKARKRMGRTLKGIGCSSGIVEGRAKVVFDPNATTSNGDHILIARSTDPGWVFLMISSKGIVVEKGSVLSHTAIIGRELGIPTIVGVKGATKVIPDGAKMSINGSTGEVQWQ